MNNDKKFQDNIKALSEKINQFNLQILKVKEEITTQEELAKLTDRIATSKTSLALLHEEVAEVSLEIKVLFQNIYS